jgi:hypothetical protein
MNPGDFIQVRSGDIGLDVSCARLVGDEEYTHYIYDGDVFILLERGKINNDFRFPWKVLTKFGIMWCYEHEIQKAMRE